MVSSQYPLRYPSFVRWTSNGSLHDGHMAMAGYLITPCISTLVPSLSRRPSHSDPQTGQRNTSFRGPVESMVLRDSPIISRSDSAGSDMSRLYGGPGMASSFFSSLSLIISSSNGSTRESHASA